MDRGTAVFRIVIVLGLSLTTVVETAADEPGLGDFQLEGSIYDEIPGIEPVSETTRKALRWTYDGTSYFDSKEEILEIGSGSGLDGTTGAPLPIARGVELPEIGKVGAGYTAVELEAVEDKSADVQPCIGPNGKPGERRVLKARVDIVQKLTLGEETKLRVLKSHEVVRNCDCVEFEEEAEPGIRLQGDIREGIDGIKSDPNITDAGYRWTLSGTEVFDEVNGELRFVPKLRGRVRAEFEVAGRPETDEPERVIVEVEPVAASQSKTEDCVTTDGKPGKRRIATAKLFLRRLVTGDDSRRIEVIREAEFVRNCPCEVQNEAE